MASPLYYKFQNYENVYTNSNSVASYGTEEYCLARSSLYLVDKVIPRLVLKLDLIH